jgi:hypothetical protein
MNDAWRTIAAERSRWSGMKVRTASTRPSEPIAIVLS